jgi:hypothetical protein
MTPSRGRAGLWKVEGVVATGTPGRTAAGSESLRGRAMSSKLSFACRKQAGVGRRDTPGRLALLGGYRRGVPGLSARNKWDRRGTRLAAEGTSRFT